MTVRRNSSLPHPRATALLARTIYRELRRARYEHEDLLRFVGDLMDLVAVSFRGDPGDQAPVEGVTDPESGLPNRSALEEIVDFELRRADEAGGGELLLLCVEVEVPEWCSDDAARAVHQRTAAALARRIRADDVVARVPPDRYFVLLRGAGDTLVLTLCARFGAELHGGIDGQPALPAGTRYSIRWIARSETAGSGAELLTACEQAPAIPLGVVEEDRPVASVSTRDLVEGARAHVTPPRPARRVVLALGGGAVRAVANVGVIEALSEAKVEIAGVAGTSAGALIGAMHLLQLSPDEIVERFESFAASPLYARLRGLYAAYMRRATSRAHGVAYFRQSELAFMSDRDVSAVPDDLYAEFIEHFVGADRDISTLAAPFAACATDIVAGRPAIFMRGPLHLALRASCAVPGLFAPQADGERLLVDGSTIAQVPIGAATELRLAPPVMAVYLETRARTVERFSTSAEVLTRNAALVRRELVREQLRSAPLLLAIPVREGGWLDFKRADEARQVGRVVARVALDGLLADLDRLGRAAPPSS